MLRKVDTSVLGVINFIWFQSIALHGNDLCGDKYAGDVIVLYSVQLTVNNGRGH